MAWPGRVLHTVLRIVLVLLLLAVVGTAALAWRLSQGPLDIAWLAHWLESSTFADGAPTRLSIGTASIAWSGFQRGSEGGLDIALHDVQLIDAAGAPVARLQEADATLSVFRLLEAQLVPRRVALAGLRLSAVRTPDGQVTLNLGGLEDSGTTSDPQGASLGDVLAELRKPAGNDRKRGNTGLQMLTQLQQVKVTDAKLRLDDKESDKVLQADLAELDLRRQGGGGVKGAASGEVRFGAATAALRLSADLLADGGTHIEAVLDPTEAAPLAQTSPAIASLGAMDASVQARATLDLSRELLPRAGALHVAAGRGRVSLADGTLSFEKLVLDASTAWSGSSWRPTEAALQRAQIVLPASHGGRPSTIGLTGTAKHEAGKITAALDLSLDHADFADLASIWPVAWAPHVRLWIVQNVTAGTARDGAFKFTLTAPEGRPQDADLVAAGGTMQSQDLTIHWLSPVPPIEHAQAVLTLVSPDVLDIAVPSGAQGALTLKDGLIHITGLSQKDQFMTLTASILGPVADAVQLLKHPRLKLLDTHPLPITSAAGSLASTLRIDMPMKADLKAEQLKIASQGRLSGLHMGGLVAGRDLDRGDIQFDVTQDGLQASGPAAIAKLGGAVTVEMDFRPGPPSQVLQHATFAGQATPAELTASGLDAGGLITSGQMGVDVSYTAQRDGTAEVDAKADLSGAGLVSAGWRKPPGPAARAAATILLKHDKLAAIEHLEAHGPGLDVVGRAELVGGRPLLFRLDRMVLGPTRASGEIRFPARPGEPIRVRLAGPTLDLSSELSSSAGRPAQGEGDWVADLQFERVVLGTGRELTGLSAHAEHVGRRLQALEAHSTGPVRLQAALVPQGNGRHLTVRAADAGAILRALNILDTVRGGALALDGQFDDRTADSPLTGTLDLSDFQVEDAVAVGKLLQAITIYGVFDALHGNGVQFTRLILPFRYDRQQLHIGQARAYSASLGLTARGWIDLSRHLLDVRGTVVPAYAVNSALGRIPLIGRLFSAERGGGLVAVNYAITGKLSDPAITVNPLSALTPGFLRGLFNMF